MHNVRKTFIPPLFIICLLGVAIFGCSDSGNNSGSEHTPDNIDDGTKQFTQDLEFIAAMPRTTGSTHHNEVQNLCGDRFESLGFEVELQQYGSGTNVIGTISGQQYPDERVIVSAHYDSVPECNGADDNASGVSGLFETAQILTAMEHDRTLIVACFDEEELGLIGSRAYTTREKEKNSNIIISYVYDMIGYKNEAPNSQKVPNNFEIYFPQQVELIQRNEFRGDFIAFLGDIRAIELMIKIDELALAENLPLTKLNIGSGTSASEMLPDALRADHAAFWEQGYPAVMITDTAEYRNPAYHCMNGLDDVDSIDAEFAMKVIRTSAGQIRESLQSDQ